MDNALDDTNNSQSLESPETPKLPRPPLTLDDIGEAPPLMNRDPRRGPRVGLKVLAFPFPPERQIEWADLNQFAMDINGFNRKLQAVGHMRRRIPKTCRVGLVPYPGTRNIPCHAIIVASNATPEKLNLAADLEQIRAVQKLLSTDEPPYWVRPVV
ncbi:hypothetical protein FPV67DRAFT_626197 [Lyophyllum atratum]|nr:hypothetical protein FPV67DRAFT_626197 [Lyophyllum atratum]